MEDAIMESLILGLLESVENGERSYEEVMEAWRTSCPRLPVWEEANDRRLVAREEVNGRCIVSIASPGLALLKLRRPGSQTGSSPRKKFPPRIRTAG
jgi:hypothetical protein